MKNALLLVYPYRHYIHHAYIMNYAISCLSISPLHPSCLQYELCHFLFIHITIYAYKYGQITRFNFHSYFIRSYKWVSFTFNLSRCNMPNGYSNIEYCLMNTLQQYYLFHYKFTRYIVHLYFFFWPLCCLFFFDIRILITPLVSSTSSWHVSILP
jgi:hypothetical protein